MPSSALSAVTSGVRPHELARRRAHLAVFRDEAAVLDAFLQGDEEEIVLRVYRKLLPRHSRLRLIIVPRHPQRFDEVAVLVLERHLLDEVLLEVLGDAVDEDEIDEREEAEWEEALVP